jgi:hypothetical protein
VPADPAPATGSCVITPQAGAVTLAAGTSAVVNLTSTGCNTTFNTPAPRRRRCSGRSLPGSSRRA